MRISELEGKEVIEVTTGERLGIIKEVELQINTENGLVEALLLLQPGWGGKSKTVYTIPWNKIRKISDELILTDANFEQEAP